MIKAIFASDLAHGLGFEGGLPWPSIKEDFQHFKNVTMGNYIIMGYKTYKTLPTLKGRTPVVVFHEDRSDWPSDVLMCDYTELATELLDCAALAGKEDYIIIGGASLLTTEFLKLCDEIHHTTVKGIYDVDVTVPTETMAYLSTLEQEVILETDTCIIRKYT